MSILIAIEILIHIALAGFLFPAMISSKSDAIAITGGVLIALWLCYVLNVFKTILKGK